MDVYTAVIQELCFDDAVSLGRCSEATVYRYARRINEQLARERADWRVKAVAKDRVLVTRNLTDEERSNQA